MQKLAARHNIHSYQTLTETHDSISCWAGLGSALATLYKQVVVPASLFGTLRIAGYLGCVSILHITIPAYLSAESLNVTVTMSAQTEGIPIFSNSSSIKYVNS
jgi:hypothetical protein